MTAKNSASAKINKPAVSRNTVDNQTTECTISLPLTTAQAAAKIKPARIQKMKRSKAKISTLCSSSLFTKPTGTRITNRFHVQAIYRANLNTS